MTKTTATIILPEVFFTRTSSGKAVKLMTADLPLDNADFLGELLVRSASIALGNAYNGKGKDTPESERLALLMKRWSSWQKGDYASAERAASVDTAIWNAYVAEQMTNEGKVESKLQADRKALVEEILGKGTTATVDAWLTALSLSIAREHGVADEHAPAMREQMEAKYTKLAEEMAVKAAQASAKIDVKSLGIDLAAFKK